MIISTSWIRDFVDFPELEPEELGKKFTLRCAEVEEVVAFGAALEQVVVAEIKSIRPHPEAEKLSLVTFTYGGETDKEVVCGAPNVEPGLKVPYAPIGVTLPNGLTLEPRKIRGILSDGMLCAEDELGLGDSHDGLLILGKDAKIGVPVLEALGRSKDTLLDIDNKSLTHRPDLWGHYGIAREFSAIFGKPLATPYDSAWEKSLSKNFTKGKSPIRPRVEKGTSCLGYCGLTIENVTVKPSPDWMQHRLLALGLRPINNMVDIGNYVMLELGIPLHIFDFDNIENSEIIIKQAAAGEKVTMLDDSEVTLTAEDTIVADPKGALVVAGVMGVERSGVTDKTNKIFIETANWHAAKTRLTSQRTGIRSDSSQRYEKSLDSNLLERTILRATELVLELCPGAKIIGDLEYDGPDRSKIKPLVIDISLSRINQVLGTSLEAREVVTALSALDFQTSEKKGVFTVSVPSYRATKDIECGADIIEEVGRMIGYENIKAKSPLCTVSPVSLDRPKVLSRQIQDFIVTHGKALEVMTYPLVGEKLLARAQWPSNNSELVLKNALSVEQNRPRPSQIPSILETVSLNQKHYWAFRMFELGRSYQPDEKDFSTESSELTLAFFNREEHTYTDAIETTEALLQYLKLSYKVEDTNPKLDCSTLPNNWSGRHPTLSQQILVMGKVVGGICAVHPLILSEFKIKGNLSITSIDLSTFEARELKDRTAYSPLPRFPSAEFDCTVITGKRVPVGEVLKVLNKLKIKEVIDTKVVDVFDLSKEENAVTVRAILQDPEKTLPGEFIKECETKILAALSKAGFPLRS